jgi:glycosyltransferase involved in cell wall biosynthesis
VVGGTGIDPEAFRPSPEPPCPPLKAAIVSRMLWTKGIDAAVEAVTLARATGLDVTLTLIGSRDPSNPACIPDDVLEEWGRRPGIEWQGRVPDVADVWRSHHVAVLPSHGEGMPRMLIEAAACGRPMIATDVSGCRTLVEPGLSGYLVRIGDAEGIARALRDLAGDACLRAAMGAVGRATILSGYTEAQVSADVIAVYRSLLGAGDGRGP